MRSLLSIGLCITLATSGCASFIAGSRTELRVAIDGPGTGVVTRIEGLSNQDVFEKRESSFVVRLKHGSDYVLRVSAPDRPDQTVRIGRHLHPAYLLNTLWLIPAGLVSYLLATNTSIGPVGGVVLYLGSLVTTPIGVGGMIFDGATNAMWAHDKDQLTITVK